MRRPKPAPNPEDDYGLHRLLTLSDGVFAIAMTLLALELKSPADWDGTAASLFAIMRPQLLSYGIAFMVVASYWVSHRQNYRTISRADRPLTLLSLLSLGFVTLVPVSTRLIIEHHQAADSLLIQMGLIAAIGTLNALAWGYAAIRPGLMDPAPSRRYRLIHFLVLLVAPLALSGLSLLAQGSTGSWSWMLFIAFFAALFIARRFRGTYAPDPRGGAA